jgi:isoaspartyl peptidase/L-asparaginase-like protein (Ntn-hydrolase superfamily)
MTTNRRRFLQLTALSAGAVALASCNDPTAGENAALHEKPAIDEGPKPLILSTWIHGLEANAKAMETLQNGGSVLDAAERGVMVTEADLSNRSVGLGGRPDREGRVTLDACIMDNQSRCGAVAFIENIDHPISVARAIMERTPHVMLAGSGAYNWALANGFKKTALKNPVPEAEEEWKKWLQSSEYKPVVNIENHDTIGLILLDAQGRPGGACTTSGMAYKVNGRIGDSPIIGAGLFVDGEVGAATATGLGEAVIRVAGSSAIVELIRHGATPQEACEDVVHRILRKHPESEGLQVGFIALDIHGRYGGYSVYNGFNFALTTAGRHEMIDAGYIKKWSS